MSRSGSTVTIATSMRSASSPSVTQRGSQVGHRRRADVRAVRVAEVHDEQPVRGRPELERLPAAGHVRQGDGVDLRLRVARHADQLGITTAAAGRPDCHRDDDGDRGEPGDHPPGAVAFGAGVATAIVGGVGPTATVVVARTTTAE